jgi:hypothetical protein
MNRMFNEMRAISTNFRGMHFIIGLRTKPSMPFPETYDYNARDSPGVLNS